MPTIIMILAGLHFAIREKARALCVHLSVFLLSYVHSGDSMYAVTVWFSLLMVPEYLWPCACVSAPCP